MAPKVSLTGKLTLTPFYDDQNTLMDNQDTLITRTLTLVPRCPYNTEAMLLMVLLAILHMLL